MTKFLGVDIAKLVHKHQSNKLNDLTIIKKGIPNRAAAKLTQGTQSTDTTHTAKGFSHENKSGFAIANSGNSRVEVGDTRIVVIVNSIKPSATIEAGDKIIDNSITYKVIKPNLDPAGATYNCEAKR